MKVPYMLIVGEKEEKDNLVSVRGRKEGDLGQLKLDEFKKKIVEKLENKKIDRN